MANETSYAVNVKYLVSNQDGRRATSELNDDVRKLDASTRSARDSFGLLGTAAAVAFGFAIHKAEDALIGFNTRVESSKISLAAMVQGFKGGEWAEAQERATRMYDEFQKFSVQTPVTTQDIMTFGKAVGAATFAAGGSIKDLTAITEQGVISAKAYGEESALASLQISEMLMGNVNSRMRFVKILLGLAHMDEAKFKGLSGEDRIKVVRGVLEGESMKNARDALGGSFEGVSSTFRDKIQIALGGAGKQLFENVKAQLAEMNAWIDKNQVKIDHLARSLSDGLSTGFGVVKDAIGFLVAHADTLLAIGKVWLAVKIGGMIGSRAGDFASGAGGRASAFLGRGVMSGPLEEGATRDLGSGLRQQMGTLRGGFGINMGGIAANAGLIAQAGAAGYALGTLFNNATGLSHTLANLALSRTDLAFEQVTKASDALTLAMERAAAAHPNTSRAITNLIGGSEELRQIANLAGDAARPRAMSGVGRSSAFDESFADATTRRLRAAEGLHQMGVSREDVDKAGGLQAFADQMNAKAEQLGERQYELGVKGLLAYEFGTRALTEYQRQTLDESKAQHDVLAYINSHGLMIDPKAIMEILRKDTEDPEGKHKKMADKPNVNIHIARIEVQSDDPDRMAFGLIEFFQDAAKNPSSAVNALREG
jgi:hypothetical protein